jgi:hypothetical protein
MGQPVIDLNVDPGAGFGAWLVPQSSRCCAAGPASAVRDQSRLISR